MKKLVEWEDILHIHESLWDMKRIADTAMYDKLKELTDYIEDNIIQQEREDLNELKRTVYLKMKHAETDEDRQHWYDVYQNLKRHTPPDR